MRPLFLACDASQSFLAWLGIVANGLMIGATAVWLAFDYDVHGPTLIFLPIDLIVAIFIADLFSGLVHWGTDTWFDQKYIGRVIAIAREHHSHPAHIVGYGFRDYVGYSSWPTLVLIGPIILALMVAPVSTAIAFNGMTLCLVVAVVIFFGTYAHRLGHKRADWAFVRLLQDANLIMNPMHHRHHHRDNHDIRYCVITGWANPICDHFGIWRGLERLVTWTTRAVAREHDRQWMAQHKKGSGQILQE